MFRHPDLKSTRQWLARNLGNIVVLGSILLVILVQWSAVKGIVYRATGGGPQDHIAWRKDYTAALDEARSSGKPVLLDFTASWCPPCQIMKHEVWPDDQVEQLANGSFIPISIDIDNEQEAAIFFRVSTFPTIIAMSSTGEVLKRAGFLDASEMVQFMDDSLKMHAPATQSQPPELSTVGQ